MGRYTQSDVQYEIDKLFAPKANLYFESLRDLRNLFEDVSDKFFAGGNTYQRPTMVDIGAANTKTAGSAVTFDNAALQKVELSIETAAEKSIAIELTDLNDIMDKYDFIDETTKLQVGSVASALETKIGKLFENFTNSVGASTTTLTKETILKAKTKAERNNIYRSFYHPFLVLAPEAEEQLLTDLGGSYSAFFDITNGAFNGTGLGASATQSRRGKVYDLPVFVSNYVPVSANDKYFTNVLAIKDAIMWASRPVGGISKEGVGITVLPFDEYMQFRTVCMAQIGAAINRDTQGAIRILCQKA